MILQSDNPIRMVRELKGAPLSILMVLSLVHQRITQEYLERATGYTDKPISQALAYLQEIGLADHTNAGWQLIKANVMQLPLPLELEEETTKENCPVKDRPDRHQEQSVPNRTEEQRSDPTDKQSSGRKLSDSVKLEEVNLTNKSLDSSSNSLNASDDGKIPILEQIKQVLSAAEDLFGHGIVGDPRDYADLDRLLAWIAQAYHRRGSGRGKIENPAGLVYWAFHTGRERKPEEKYLKEPDRYLPDSFLRGSGQWEFEDDE